MTFTNGYETTSFAYVFGVKTGQFITQNPQTEMFVFFVHLLCLCKRRSKMTDLRSNCNVTSVLQFGSKKERVYAYGDCGGFFASFCQACQTGRKLKRFIDFEFVLFPYPFLFFIRTLTQCTEKPGTSPHYVCM